ncbi:MAG: Holliday junction branch migration protein RuvA [Pseudobdellovibrionaceae bacterium]
MIGLLQGEVFSVTEDSLYLLVNGVGYEVASTHPNIDQWSTLVGEKVTIWIYTHVREDEITLFGFQSQEEKSFFLSLLKVNGVGPRLAMNILSGASLNSIRLMIENSDAKGLSQIPKVGKKTAEQMILTLKGKLVQIEKEKPVVQRQHHREVVFALTNLGFKPSDVEQYVAELPTEIVLEEAIRQGLQKFSQSLKTK